MNRQKILCVMGKSGVGKSSIIDKICEDNRFNYIRSKTTREIRKDDPNDKNTHTFTTSKELFENIMFGKVLAVYSSPLSGYVNWTSDDLILKNKINVLAIDPISFVDFVNKYNNKYDLYGIYLELDEDIRQGRLFKRGDVMKNEPWLDSSFITDSSIPYYYYSIIDNNVIIEKQIDFILNCILKEIGWINV